MTSRDRPSFAPNRTLYCKNLPDKLQKIELRRSLYLLFATYGPILDIVALKTPKMRGQAHIVFRDLQSSVQAMRTLQDFEFFGKQMKLEYAKGKSDTIAKLDGTYKMPTKDVEVDADTAMTDLQRSVFGGAAPVTKQSVPEAAKGVKRVREEESEQEDAPMDEDDDDAAMEESDSD